MVREAEMNAAADKAKREKIETKNQAEQLCYQAEKQLSELGDKVSTNDKDRLTSLIANLRSEIGTEAEKKPIESIDFGRVKSLMQDLQQTLYSVGSSVYQSAQSSDGTGSSSSGSSGSGGDDEVIDAEFSETK